jgi:hypothetical protein
MLKIDGTDENVDSKSARAAQLSETAIRLETQVERTATDVSNRRRALRELKRSLVVRFPLLHQPPFLPLLLISQMLTHRTKTWHVFPPTDRD